MNQQPISNFYTNIFKQDAIGNETRKIFIKYLATTIVVIICSFTLFNILTQGGSAEYNVQKYFFLYTLPFVFVLAFILNLYKNTEVGKFFLKLLGLIGVFIFCVYLYATSENNVNISSTTRFILISLITLLGLGIIHKTLVRNMEKAKGWYGLIAQLIFYIPCIFNDVWEYIIQQINLTPYSIYLLLFIEIILVITYIFLPTITYNLTGGKDSLLLVDNVQFLDNPQIVANSQILKIDEGKYGGNNYYRNYCISMWVYINNHDSSKEPYNVESEIMSYGFTDKDGVQHVKPMIRYYGGGGGNDQLIERNKYVFYFVRYPPVNQYATDKHTFYDVTIENQKWNQIVLNYNRNNVELYINGKIERTFSMAKNMPEYNDLDTITIGQENGLDGGICNVVYYKHPLSPDQIALSYNSMVISEIPVPQKKI